MTSDLEPVPDWTETPPHPWRRLLARLCDYSIFQTIFTILIYAVQDPVRLQRLNELRAEPMGLQFFSMLTALLSALPIALLIAATGTSPGKWCFGIRVARKDGGRLGFLQSLGREMRVLFLGLGGTFFVFALIAGLIARSRLLKEGETSWDARLGTCVLYRPNSPFRATLGVAVTVLPYALAFAVSAYFLS